MPMAMAMLTGTRSLTHACVFALLPLCAAAAQATPKAHYESTIDCSSFSNLIRGLNNSCAFWRKENSNAHKKEEAAPCSCHL